MSQFSPYGLGGSKTPAYYDDFDNKGLLSLTENITTTDNDSEIRERYGNYLIDAPPNPLTFEEYKNLVEARNRDTELFLKSR